MFAASGALRLRWFVDFEGLQYFQSGSPDTAVYTVNFKPCVYYLVAELRATAKRRAQCRLFFGSLFRGYREVCGIKHGDS